MVQVPTPEEAEHVMFWIKWYKEFFLGLAAIFATIATIKRGQKMPIVSSVTPDGIEVQMLRCKSELKSEITDMVSETLEAHNKDMLREIKLLIENASLRAKIKE